MIKNFLLKKEYLPVIIMLTCMIVFGLIGSFFTPINNIFLIMASLGWGGFCIFAPFQDCLAVCLFMVSFEVIDFTGYPISFYQTMCFVFCIISSIKYAVSVIIRKQKLIYAPYAATIVLIICSFTNLNIENIVSLGGFLTTILILYLAYANLDTKDSGRLENFYILGIIASIVISLPLIPIKEVIINSRFAALCKNVNTLQFLSLIAMAILIIKKLNGQINNFCFYFTDAFFIVAGIFTMSKTFLIVMIILCIYYFWRLFKKNKLSAKKKILIIGGFLLVCFVLLGPQIFRILKRFNIDSVSGVLDKITTKRYTIWANYLSIWSQSPYSIFVGIGLSANQPLEYGYHSSYIELLVKMGVVGIALLIFLVYSYLYAIKMENKEISCKKALPILVFALVGFVECVFAFRVVLILCLLLMVGDKSEGPKYLKTVRGINEQ